MKSNIISSGNYLRSIREILFVIAMFVVHFGVLAQSQEETDEIPEILKYHGMGNLLSSGFMTYDDGTCKYISLNTLTGINDTTGTRPFSVKLPSTPKAYWLEKNILNCVFADSAIVRVEVREPKADESIGLKSLSTDDAESILCDINIYYEEYLEDLNPEIYSWFYKVVYDYYNSVEQIRLKIPFEIEKEEFKNYRKVNYTITFPEAKFYFINVPPRRIRDCMHIAGSFERVERSNFRNQRTD